MRGFEKMCQPYVKVFINKSGYQLCPLLFFILNNCPLAAWKPASSVALAEIGD